MKDCVIAGEVKTLMIQLLRGVGHLHDNWIIHRDLKTSNLLLSHKGILKASNICTPPLNICVACMGQSSITPHQGGHLT